MTDSRNILISIVLCCHNSIGRLNNTLKYIAQLQIPDTINLELILIDNASDDGTDEYASSKWEQLGNPFPLRIEHEEKKGLSYARKRGVSITTSKFILFCDDDNWLKPDYIFNFVQSIKEYPNLGMIGGRSVPYSDSSLPFWFTSVQSSYAVGIQDLQTGFIDGQHKYLWGAGLIINNNIISELFNIGLSPLLSDRTGNNLSSGGDTELNYWFKWTGASRYYNEDIVLIHYMPSVRLKKSYYKEMQKGHSDAWTVIEKYEQVDRHWARRKNIIKRVLLFLIYFSLYCIKTNNHYRCLAQLFSFIPFITIDLETKKIISYKVQISQHFK